MEFTRNGKKYEVADGHDWFWPQYASGAWEPSTFRIFDQFLNPDRNFVDIGAWIGPTALYAAPRAAKVFAFEPDPAAYKSLCRNLDLNGAMNAIPYMVGVAEKWKSLDFGFKIESGDSMSSVLWAKEQGMQVPAISLESVIIDLAPNFIKIDIEGGEKNLFKGAQLALRELKPTIHLSLHTPWFLQDLVGYMDSIRDALDMYPYFYDENLEPIKLADAFDPARFNSVVATFNPII